MYSVKEPNLSPKIKEKYESVWKLYNILKEPKNVWFSSSSENKTVDIIDNADIKLFSMLYDLERNIDSPLNFTENELISCFRNKNGVNFDLVKQQAIEIFHILQNN